MPELSVKRAADRKKMVAALAKIAAANGATFDYTPCYSGRGYSCSIIKGVFAVGIRLDSASRVGCFLGHWYSKQRFPIGFGQAINGSVNQYHGCKATLAAEGWDYFCELLELGLQLLDGEPDPQYTPCCGADLANGRGYIQG